MEASETSRYSQVKYKGMRRRLRLLMVVVVCFMGWAALTLWGQTDRVSSKKGDLEVMEAKLLEVQQLNDSYHHEITRLNDPEYIEQLIRKGLNMTKPEETIFIQTE